MKIRAITSSTRCSLLGLSFAAAVMLMLGACAAPSAWQRSLRTGPDLMPRAAANAAVTVRRVPWERVQKTLGAIEAKLAASDRHPDEWNQAERESLEQMLLTGIQVSQPAERVLVLGDAQFRTTDDLSGAEGELSRMARNLGADMVVWSTRVLGKADKISQEPVTTHTNATGWYRDSNNDRKYDSYNATSTTWVPIRLSVDETGAVAFFLRVNAM